MDYTINTFDWEFYVDQYKDLKDAGILTKEKAWSHWCTYGCNENRMNKKINEELNLNYTNMLNKFVNSKQKTNIENILKNKRIVIVGPCENVNDGKFIDSFDVVVRCNNGHKLTKIPEKYGSRTDLLYHCVSQNENNGGPIAWNQHVTKFAYPILINNDNTSFNFKFGNLFDYSNINIEGKFDLHILDRITTTGLPNIVEYIEGRSRTTPPYTQISGLFINFLVIIQLDCFSKISISQIKLT